MLSGDIQITRRPAERAAWHRSKLNGLFLAPGWRKMRTVEQAGKLLLWWPSLVQAEKVIAPGAIFQLSINPGSKLAQIPI